MAILCWRAMDSGPFRGRVRPPSCHLIGEGEGRRGPAISLGIRSKCRFERGRFRNQALEPVATTALAGWDCKQIGLTDLEIKRVVVTGSADQFTDSLNG